MNLIRASLFVTTYELPRHLALVCAGLARQTSKEFEVLFCDDGSKESTHEVIQEFQSQSPVPSRHFWQEHQGFRKCRILNQALAQARGKVCIFLDGDCVPHRSFVQDHLDLQEKGYYLAGRRVEVGEKLSAQLTPQKIRSGYFDYPHWSLIQSSFQKDTEFLNRSIRIPFPKLRQVLGMHRIADMKGCNYSVSKENLEAINGFDETYEGYGREDTDVEIRLQNLGLQIKSLKGVALQFHIWHPRRDFTPANDQRLENLKTSRRVWCENGLTKL
jgi:glycosyltransferase involved in cell wall biosynthesis